MTRGLPLAYGNVALRICWADIVGTRANQAIVVELLDHMAAQPLIRETANTGVNRSTSMPSMW